MGDHDFLIKRYWKPLSVALVLVLVVLFTFGAAASSGKSQEPLAALAELESAADGEKAGEVSVPSGQGEGGKTAGTTSAIRSGKDIYPYTIVRSVRYGSTVVEVDMNLLLYSKGSFRSMDAYLGGQVYIRAGMANVYLEDSGMTAWSPGGFPSHELYYGVNGTLVAEVAADAPDSVADDLLEGGFSLEYTTVDGTAHYRNAFHFTGIVDLYDGWSR